MSFWFYRETGLRPKLNKVSNCLEKSLFPHRKTHDRRTLEHFIKTPRMISASNLTNLVQLVHKMAGRPAYVENFHLHKTDMSPKTRQFTFDHELAIKECFVLNKHQIKMVKGLLISKTIFFTSDALQFWCKNIFSDRPKKVKKILGSRFFHFRQNIIFWNNLFFENNRRIEKERHECGRSANQMVDPRFLQW